MKKMQSTIINASLSSITNEKTGEVSSMTKITYTVKREDTDIMVGPAILECYKIGNFLEKIKGNIMKLVEIELDEKPTKNGVKYVITKVNNVQL